MPYGLYLTKNETNLAKLSMNFRAWLIVEQEPISHLVNLVYDGSIEASYITSGILNIEYQTLAQLDDAFTNSTKPRNWARNSQQPHKPIA